MDYNTYRRTLRDGLAGSEVPFSADELDRREEKVRQAMAARGLDVLLLTAPADIYYLTGYNTFEVSVHACLALGPGYTALQVPSIETGPAVVCTRVSDLMGYRWEDSGGPLAPLADLIAGSREIGYDPWQPGLRAGLLDGLRQARPECRFHDAADLLPPIRRVKSTAELECLRESARLTQAGLDAAVAVVRTGVSDSTIAAEGARAMLAGGSEFMSMQPIVTTGVRSSVIHANHNGRTVAADDPVFMEFGASVRRYTAPQMRTRVCGTPDADMERVADTCRAIYTALVENMQPGISFDAAARAAEAALVPLEREAFFSGVFGYTVGAGFPPSWVEGTGFIARDQDVLFRENMVFHLPLCLRLPGRWGIGMSETVRVCASGAAEPLTHNDWSLVSGNPSSSDFA
ncbi:Xaa-Pro peptidase family protein [Aquisalimonas lutea]|uniref:M24 family metallopeptidase n=1 Tax=Aquisalimonas lutea TaxID=1327750 RepID=UPI0025B4AA77|nr:Xaa-Pro peptidase family protein [Aquisalimonas lutea]MDN3517737.1 Xaa-Pro peptidase family protein [Aquisalimonas lutea]